MFFPFLYVLLGMGVLGAALSAYDKIAAKHLPRHRVRERTLLLVGAFGGAWIEWLTMRLIRHKTLHKRFMWGLPAFGIVHAALLAYLYYKEFGL